jgi:hemerythrin-like domain-containing protein
MEDKPMPGLKRHPALQDLSRDHQRFLLEARAIQWLMEGDRRAMPLNETIESLLFFWEVHGEPHLREEEKVLLPVCLGDDPLPQPDIERVLADHQWLRYSIAHLRDDDSLGVDGRRQLLAEIGQHITSHVRFEERVLFSRAQEILDEDELAWVAKHSRAFREEHRSPEVIGPIGSHAS